MASTTTIEPQVDEEFETWMRQFQQRDFFTNNLITLVSFTVLGGAVPVFVNFLQLRPGYRRPWLIPCFAVLGMALGNLANEQNARVVLRLHNDIDYYVERGVSKGDRFHERKPGVY